MFHILYYWSIHTLNMKLAIGKPNMIKSTDVLGRCLHYSYTLEQKDILNNIKHFIFFK